MACFERGGGVGEWGGSDFIPGCNWEVPPPGYSTCVNSLENIGSTPQGHTCPDLLWQPSKAGKIWECWQLWPVVGGVGNGVAEEGWCWDLNPGAAAMRHLLEDHMSLGSFWDHVAWAEKHGLLFLFLRYGTPDCSEEEGRTVHLWVF